MKPLFDDHTTTQDRLHPRKRSTPDKHLNILILLTIAGFYLLLML